MEQCRRVRRPASEHARRKTCHTLPVTFRTMANSKKDQRMDREAIRAAEQAMIEAGFGFTMVLEETGRQEAEAALATRTPLAA